MWYLLSRKVDGKMIFTDYGKFLVLNFSVVENRSFWSQEVDGKDDICWFPRSSCFELFGDGNKIFFISEEVDEKIIFTWSF